MEKLYPMSRAAVVAAAVLVAPLIGLIAFSAPQADDFCLGAAYREHGFLGGVVEFRRVWTGRIAANALIMVPFAVSDGSAGMLAAYRLMLLALMVMWLAAGYAAVRLWFSETRLRVVIWALFAAAFIVWPPNFREQAIWLSSAATYMPATLGLTALFLFLFAPLLRRFEGRATLRLPAGLGAWCGVGAATAIASLANEFSGFAAIFFAAASFASRRASSMPTQAWGHAAIVVIAIACLAALASSPGNAVRAAYFDDSGSLSLTLGLTPLHTIEFFLYHALMPSHIAWYGAFVVAAAQAPPLKDGRAARCAALFIVVSTVCAVAVAYAAGLWGTDNRLPGRAQNQLHLMAAVSLSTALALFVRSGVNLAALDVLRRMTARAPYVAAGAVFLLVAANPNTYAAYATIFSGDAGRYFSDSRARLSVLAEAPPGADVVLPRYKVLPVQLSPFDLRANDNYNDCDAAAFGLKSATTAP